MSSETGVPKTAVDLSLTDPVERARAELKAALAAIEDKTNVPKQVSKATDIRAAVCGLTGSSARSISARSR